GDHALLVAAQTVLREAGEIASAFIEHGLPSAFLDNLADDIKALENAGSDYEAVRQAGVAATAGIDAVLARGFASVHRLDAIVANVCRADTPMSAVWQVTRHVAQRRRSAAPGRAAVVAPIRLATNVA